MLRAGIIGCGKIADQHVAATQRIADCGVVAVCDRELLMAKQMGERFGIPGVFGDVAKMIEASSLDAVHITTPPQSHFALAKQCLEAGCHVYLEKPFTVTGGQAKELVAEAESRKLKITAGHNYQFTPEMIEMRRLVRQGFLGGAPVHLESHWSYDLSDTNYVGPVLGSQSHWVRQLPGQLLQNIISHGVARLAEFLEGGTVEVVAMGQQSPRLRSLGGQEVLDELRVMLKDAKGTTAYFSFSTQIKPGLNQFRICGPAQSLLMDMSSGSLVRQQKVLSKSYLTYFLPPLKMGQEHARNAWRNFRAFLRRELYQDFGMKELIERFYGSIRTGGEPPIPYREIVLTAWIMDEIFRQVYGGKAEEERKVVRHDEICANHAR